MEAMTNSYEYIGVHSLFIEDKNTYGNYKHYTFTGYNPDNAEEPYAEGPYTHLVCDISE